MNKPNIGNFARWILRQTLGSKDGQEIIDFVEGGYMEAFRALKNRDFEGFLAALPDRLEQEIVKAVASRFNVPKF